MQLININYAIDSTWLFQNLHFCSPMGNIIGLVGMNGSGKSTLLKIMAGLSQPHRGHVHFKNKDLYVHRHLQKHIGYVPSMPFLFPTLTLYENIAWLLSLRCLPPLPPFSIEVFLEAWELTDYTHSLYHTLSDGIKKRVNIASAFLHQPDLLILDEPCAGLDPKQRQACWERLKQYQHPSRLIIISSHHPEELHTFCDIVYLLSQGELLQYFPSPVLTKHLWDTIATHSDTKKETVE